MNAGVIMSVIGFDKTCQLEVDGKILNGGIIRTVMPPERGTVEEVCKNNSLDIEVFDHFDWNLFFKLRSAKQLL
jgi:hypothetical protein